MSCSLCRTNVERIPLLRRSKFPVGYFFHITFEDILELLLSETKRMEKLVFAWKLITVTMKVIHKLKKMNYS